MGFNSGFKGLNPQQAKKIQQFRKIRNKKLLKAMAIYFPIKIVSNKISSQTKAK
jgi:hypothetical protein